MNEMEAEVRGRCRATIARMRRSASASCSGEIDRRSPATIALLATTLSFPAASPRAWAGWSSISVPAQEQPGRHGEIGLAPKLLMEGVQDPRGLEDRPAAALLREDARGVSGLAGHLQPPGHAPPPRHGRVFPGRVANPRLEIERDVAPPRGGQELLSRGLDRIARILLVPDQGHHDLAAVESSAGTERAQRLEHHHVAAFHVGDPRAPRRVAQPLEPLKRALLLEHGVQVADEKEPLPSVARALGEEVAGPGHGGPSIQRVSKPIASSSRRRTSATRRTPTRFSVPLF